MIKFDTNLGIAKSLAYINGTVWWGGVFLLGLLANFGGALAV